MRSCSVTGYRPPAGNAPERRPQLLSVGVKKNNCSNPELNPLAFTAEQKKAWRALPRIRERQSQHQRSHRTKRRLEALERGEVDFGPHWSLRWFVQPPRPPRLHPVGYRHGMRYSPEYRIWKGIIQRCENPANPNFARYGGGRGISVCREWRADFLKFFHDMGRRPSHSHLLIRIDKDFGYSASNCAWATRLVEADNRRRRHVVIYQGQKHCLAFVCRALRLSQRSVEYEMARGHGVVTSIKRAAWRKDHPGRSITRKIDL